MTADGLAITEQHFLEGKASGDAGLGVDSCPYPAATNEIIPPQQILIARINWMSGWRFARHTGLLHARQTKRAELVAALAKVMPLQEVYAQHLTTLRHGFWPSPLRYWKANKELERLQRHIWKSHEYTFLQAMAIQLYLPFHQENYRTFAVFDEQERLFPSQDLNDWTRELMKRHGYKQSADTSPDLRDLVAESGGSEAIHVY